jgi:hypothetical protein
MTLPERKQKLRDRIANSPASSDISLLDFGRLLTAIDTARSNSAISQIERDWKQKVKELSQSVVS